VEPEDAPPALGIVTASRRRSRQVTVAEALSARGDVVERAEDAAVAREVDAGLFQGLAHRGVREIVIANPRPPGRDVMPTDRPRTRRAGLAGLAVSGRTKRGAMAAQRSLRVACTANGVRSAMRRAMRATSGRSRNSSSDGTSHSTSPPASAQPRMPPDIDATVE
jgi:hypothetical protein